jgi:hypothetical protein
VSLLSGPVIGQGYVNFNNLVAQPGPEAPMSLPDGTPLGSDYYGQLFAAAGETPENSLQPVGVPVLFRNGSEGAPTGAVNGGTVEIPGVTPAGGPATVQLRAWLAASGTTWEKGVAGGIYGTSNVIHLSSTGNGTTTAPRFLVGLVPSTLIVPEPGAWALFGLGSLVLALLRPGRLQNEPHAPRVIERP